MGIEKMDIKEFDYDLPQELIAQTPLANREGSRLLVLDRETGEMEHRHFSEIRELLRPGDLLVLNDSRVIPARIFGIREGTGAKVEFLLLKRTEGNRFECLVKPGRKARPGERFQFGEGRMTAEILGVIEDGVRIVEFACEGELLEVLDEIGLMPLPPYITEKLEQKERYQTVYAHAPGSAAAPTAGLHFTKELLSDLEKEGVELAYVTLHVGLGTFRPVKVERIEEHQMHTEWYTVSEKAAEQINCAKREGRRVICVGTTSCRTVESAADENGIVRAGSADTGIFIYPGYRFKVLDALITNFHLPESTLLMLVSALAGRENVLRAYREAIEKRYRFFSFGDAMFVR